MLHGKVTQSSDTRLLSYIYQHHQYCQNNCSQHHHHRNTGHFLSFFYRSQPQGGFSVALSTPKGGVSGSLPQGGFSVALSAPTGDLSDALSPNGGSQWHSQPQGGFSVTLSSFWLPVNPNCNAQWPTD